MLCQHLYSLHHDTTLGLNSRHDFVHALFCDFESVPFALWSVWMGYMVLQNPKHILFGSMQQQDSAKLMEMKKGDMRFVYLCGNEDKLVDGVTSANTLKAGRYLGKVEIELKVVEGGSHTLFVDNEQETVDVLIGFAESIQVRLNSLP
jgi:pimeloyl-ACP methyl ester carboxylesterase